MSQEIKVSEFEDICRKISDLQLQKDELTIKVDAITSELEKLKENAQKMLEAVDKDSYKSEYGTLYTTTRTQYQVPKGEKKQAFFEYLKSQNLFDEVVTVGSQWLNGYVRKEEQFARENGQEFSPPPGIESAYTKTEARLRKS